LTEIGRMRQFHRRLPVPDRNGCDFVSPIRANAGGRIAQFKSIRRATQVFQLLFSEHGRLAVQVSQLNGHAAPRIVPGFGEFDGTRYRR
jgi:hypothetical protein